MYDLIQGFIDHTWVTTTNQGDQQYIYAISCILLVVFVVKVIDLISDVFHSFIK